MERSLSLLTDQLAYKPTTQPTDQSTTQPIPAGPRRDRAVRPRSSTAQLDSAACTAHLARKALPTSGLAASERSRARQRVHQRESTVVASATDQLHCSPPARAGHGRSAFAPSLASAPSLLCGSAWAAPCKRPTPHVPARRPSSQDHEPPSRPSGAPPRPVSAVRRRGASHSLPATAAEPHAPPAHTRAAPANRHHARNRSFWRHCGRWWRPAGSCSQLVAWRRRRGSLAPRRGRRVCSRRSARHDETATAICA